MMRKPIGTLLGAIALLAACGGGGGGDAASVADAVPPEAMASAGAFTGYVAAQAEDDRREPLAMDGVVPPTSETAEPLPVAR